MRICCLGFWLFLFLAPYGAAQTDSSVTQPDSLLKAAQRYLSHDSTDSARTLFETILADKPDARQAMLGLIQTDVAEEEWGDALSRSEDLLTVNPVDVAAHYYAGICERELGAQRAGPMRKMAWDRARHHFEAAIAGDSLFQDVLFQFARFSEYDAEYPEAIALAERQILARPDQVDAQIGLFHIYRHYIADTDPEDALAWLQSRGDDYGRYFAAEVLRRTRRFPEAESLFTLLLKNPSVVPPQACYLSLALIFASQKDDARAETAYWKGVDGIASWLGAALIFEELKYIITDKELERYRSLSSDRNKREFFHAFWRLRDPMPATAINYRLTEHFRRYVHAEEEFEFYGFRTGFSNPDRTKVLKQPKAFYLNKEFNDKGMLFLRQGPPDKIERTMGNMSSFGPTTVDPHEAWLYEATENEPLRIFHFARHNTASNNWRLTPLPGDPNLLDRDMLENLAMYDTRYFRLQQGNPLEAMQLVSQMQVDAEQTVSEALTTDRYVLPKGTTSFSVPHSIDAFRSSRGRTLLDISYAIPFSPLREAAGNGPLTMLLETGISTTSLDGRMLGSRLDTLSLTVTPDGSGSFIGLFRQLVAPDSVRLTVHVRALTVPAVGTWTEHVRIPSFAGKNFMLSDLQLLLPASAGPSIEIDGVKVVQSPFNTYPREKPLYAYLQVYNLVKDFSGKAGYDVAYAIAPKDEPTESTLLAELKRDLSDDSRAEFRQLDVSKVEAGTYLLTVTVTDRKRVQTLTRSREIEITK
jgi:GWxTD domain-containing protein